MPEIRKLLKPHIPPSLFTLRGNWKRRRAANQDFQKCWQELQAKYPSLDSVLVSMVNDYIRTERFRSSGKMWKYLSRMHLEQIARDSLRNMRLTVAGHYYTYSGLGPVYEFCQKNALSSNGTAPISELFRIHRLEDGSPGWPEDACILYNVLTVALYDYVQSIDKIGVLTRLEDPDFGSPPCIKIQGRRVSQDILHSACEILKISTRVDPHTLKRVMEIGAGWGRTAQAFLSFLPGLKYLIVDIPPALYVSQSCLSASFPEKKIFQYRAFEKFESVADEFEAADIAFLLPDQLKLLPNRSVSLAMGIDSLHEMVRSDIEFYFSEVARVADAFYMKSKKLTGLANDYRHDEGVMDNNWRTSKGNYPKLPGFKNLFTDDHPLDARYFEAIFARDA